MTQSASFEAKFWDALARDRTVMLGVDTVGLIARPMTALRDGDHGPVWFFTAKKTALAMAAATEAHAALFTFASKNHDLFAHVHGHLSRDDNNRDMIDKLWNPFIAAWYPHGKDDPSLALLRFDAHQAEIWLNENSFAAGLKILLGIDPKKDYADKTATVPLNAHHR